MSVPFCPLSFCPRTFPTSALTPFTEFPWSHGSEIPVLFQSKFKHFPVLFVSWHYHTLVSHPFTEYTLLIGPSYTYYRVIHQIPTVVTLLCIAYSLQFNLFKSQQHNINVMLLITKFQNNASTFL